MLQQVTAEQVKVQQVEKEGQIKVQEAEIARHEKELIATVLKGAEIERQRIENLASAEKARLTDGSRRPRCCDSFTGRSGSQHHLPEGRGGSEGDERKGRGLPGMEPGRSCGQAADQHGRCCAGDGGAAVKGGQDHHRLDWERWSPGMHKITGDMTKIAAQVPALFEALSGMDIKQLMSNVQAIKDKPKANGDAAQH